MKYYIVFLKNEKKNKFVEVENENELIKILKSEKNALLSDFEIFLKII